MKKILLSAAIATLYAGAGMAQVVGDNSFEIQSRIAHFDVEYPVTNNGSDDFRQTVLAHQLKYASPMINNMIGFNGNLFLSSKLNQGGKTKDEMLPYAGTTSALKGEYAVLGEAYLKLKYDGIADAKIGRQFHSSLLLRSTTSRALPDTYSGYTFNVYPLNGLKLYAHQYDKVLARNADAFTKFRTEITTAGAAGSSPGDIDYIRILGGQYNYDRWQVNFESLNSKNYLRKNGVVVAYTMPVLGKDTLKLSAGYSTTSDAGDLFKCGAETEFDTSGTGRCHNDGKGGYVDAEWKTGEWVLGITAAKFNGYWIEDNYASQKSRYASANTDPGTSFFPTQANGNDMTNNNEFVRAVRATYNWKNYIPGLTTNAAFKMGTGATKADGTGGPASEYERSLGFKYAIPQIKNLTFSYLYLNYGSSNGAAIKAIQSANKVERIDHRLYLDYTYKFY